ncbi:MAG: hypothetical protein HZR80_09630 [Candidatus Heimdallarchaeota archaeon]
MSQEKCEFCNSELVTVKGELICTTCGLVNKQAIDNKEKFISPSFFQERKLKQERVNDQRKFTINHMRKEMAYIANYLELSNAVQNQAYLIILDILKRERKIAPNFPWHINTQNSDFNCLIALSILVAIKKVVGEFKQIAGILEFYRTRGEELSLNDIKTFSNNLFSKYDYLDGLLSLE